MNVTEGEPPRSVLRAVDAVLYALAVAAVAFALATAISFLLGGRWVGAKYLLMWGGFLLFGYATFLLWPKGAWADRVTVRTGEETPFQAAVANLPPLRWYPLPPGERLPASVKLFLASVAVLATSYVMEAAFGVAAVG